MAIKTNYSGLKGWQVDDLYEERAAILEYDAGKSRWDAEQMAAQMMGFANKSDLKIYVQERKANENDDTTDGGS